MAATKKAPAKKTTAKAPAKTSKKKYRELGKLPTEVIPKAPAKTSKKK